MFCVNVQLCLCMEVACSVNAQCNIRSPGGAQKRRIIVKVKTRKVRYSK